MHRSHDACHYPDLGCSVVSPKSGDGGPERHKLPSTRIIALVNNTKTVVSVKNLGRHSGGQWISKVIN